MCDEEGIYTVCLAVDLSFVLCDSNCLSELFVRTVCQNIVYRPRKLIFFVYIEAYQRLVLTLSNIILAIAGPEVLRNLFETFASFPSDCRTCETLQERTSSRLDELEDLKMKIHELI